MREPDLSRFIVVLSRAEEAGNVGSVCRAMKTMGLTRLRLAGCPAYDEERIRTMSVHAFDLYEAAERFPDLPGALADTVLSAGFTRRRGERRKDVSQALPDFARWLLGSGARGEAGRAEKEALDRRTRAPGAPGAADGGKVALVFGNERTGLTVEELGACSRAVHIPSSEAFPSLNLAMAVQLAAWEIREAAFRAAEGRDGGFGQEAEDQEVPAGEPGAAGGLAGPAGAPEEAAPDCLPGAGGYLPATRSEVEAAVGRVATRLGELGFFRLNQGEELRTFLRDTAERAGLSPGELRYLESIFHKAASLAKQGGPKKG